MRLWTCCKSMTRRMQGGSRMLWIIELQEPYTKHTFRAVSAHRRHGEQMNTGFRNETIRRQCVFDLRRSRSC